MKIIVAPDSYKGSLSAAEVADCMEAGIRDAMPDAEVVKIPMADGGEGTVEAIVTGMPGSRLISAEVVGPLGEPVTATFGVLPDGRTAIIEMAAASGITLVPRERLDPLAATTYGTGELIRAALDEGCRTIWIGLGGSATNDGGAGAARALGVRLYDESGNEVPLGGGALGRIRRIDVSELDPRLVGCDILIASDVTNPLCGPEGAAAVFGPQKGATTADIAVLERNMEHYCSLLLEQLGKDVRDVPGSGAAGGLGAGLMAFLSARTEPGVALVLEATRFEERVRDADLVLTGEGRTDEQTAYGKAPAGIAGASRRYGVPVICLSGGITLGAHGLRECGFDVAIGATQAPIPLEEAIRDCREWIRGSTASAMRLVRIGSRL